MTVSALILVKPSLAGNLGAAIRVAANFRVPRVELVDPGVDPSDPDVTAWACGAHEMVGIRTHRSLREASKPYRTLIASASGRGRDNQPLITPREALGEIQARGSESAALVFGNETRGLSREDLDRCDLVVRIPTDPSFPVLNLTQSIAILLGFLCMELAAPEPTMPEPASQELVAELMEHLESSLADIGFLDPDNPQRMLRKLRRLFGRAGITENEVAIMRGICRQMAWAARTGPLRETGGKPNGPR
jgi:TrmH family RNA methyltransferase